MYQLELTRTATFKTQTQFFPSEGKYYVNPDDFVSIKLLIKSGLLVSLHSTIASVPPQTKTSPGAYTALKTNFPATTSHTNNRVIPILVLKLG